jgi:uncharacterized repeat protein (TIGR01451 family)
VVRKLVTILAVAFAAFAWAGIASAANGDPLRQINANTNGTACGDSSGGFKVGVGIAFDGTNLLVSCYNDSTVTAVSPVNGSQVAIHHIFGASSLGALAWDNGRGLLWGCSAFNTVGTINLITDVFTPAFVAAGCFDGLAYDGSDDSIWASGDAAPTTEHYTIAGVLLSSHAWGAGLGGCGNSGIAVGGPLLYLADNGCSKIYTSPKDFSSAPAFFATFPRRLEDMECDNVDFPATGAMWSKDAYDNILNAWEIPEGSCIFGGGRSDITLTPSDKTNDVGTSHTVTANVTDRNGPVAGAKVIFTVSGANTATGTGTTDASGNASFTYTGTAAGDDTITACYDKNGNGVCESGEPTATATKHWIVRNADLSAVKTGPAFVANGGPITYTIAVTNNGPATARNVVVVDTLSASITGATATPSQGSCSGSFTCNLGDIASGGSATITIHGTVSTSDASVSNTACASSDNPDPDSSNNCSTTKATVFILGPGSGGAFVVGDQSAVGAVTFWGAQWWKLNSLSGGSAPAAFKGFAKAPASPACGVNWTTTPGNSPPPPAPPLPALMGVIVSSSISQSGSTISGNTVHIVIVQTNPGYDANPGHAGTGTVIATYC